MPIGSDTIRKERVNLLQQVIATPKKRSIFLPIYTLAISRATLALLIRLLIKKSWHLLYIGRIEKQFRHISKLRLDFTYLDVEYH